MASWEPGNKADQALQKIETERQWKQGIFWTSATFLTIFILSCSLWDILHAQRIFALRAVPFAIFTLYGLTWLVFGHDARHDEIRPRPTPPEGMTPGFMECVRNRKIPKRAMVNDLLWLAAKGWICFCHSQPEGAHLRRTTRVDKPQSPFFCELLERLFPQGCDILYLRTFLFIRRKEQVFLYEAYQWWEQQYKEACKPLWWSYNTRVSFIAFALVLVVCEAMAWQAGNSWAFMMQFYLVMMVSILLMILVCGLILLAVGVFSLSDGSYVFGPLGILFGIVCIVVNIGLCSEVKHVFEEFDPGVFVLMSLMLSTAFFLSRPRLFAAGARLQGEIEGYARYLAIVATGVGRMEAQEFEEALPYVFSLGEAYATRFRVTPPENVSRFITRHPNVQDVFSESLWLWKSFCLYRDEVIKAINRGGSPESPPD
jgi:hypothetical protein